MVFISPIDTDPGGIGTFGTGVVEAGVDTRELGDEVEDRDEISDPIFSRADDSSVADNGGEDVDVTGDAGEGGCVAKAEQYSAKSSTGCDARSIISATGGDGALSPEVRSASVRSAMSTMISTGSATWTATGALRGRGDVVPMFDGSCGET